MLGRVALLLCLTIATAAHAQTWRAPRTPSGAPDLEGVWDNDSMTSLQRPKGFAALVATPYEAAAFEAKRYARFAKVIAPVDPNAPAPELDKVTDDDRFEHPRGLDRIRGEIRSSQITDPASGRLPYRPDAQAAADKALKDEEVFDHPEGRPFDERCLLGGGGGVAAPITNRDHVKIVQTRDHVVLFGEQNHEARVVRLGDRRHLPAAMAPWMGDSVGWWEGEVLVVETTHLSPRDGWRWNSGDWIKLSADTRIVERFARTAPAEISYSFVVEDPANYTQAWRGEATFRATTAPMFEYACHEGNYALTNILAGGRAEDARKTKVAP
ncbi:MAG TPA: hypothetical protein VF495_00685 [Phenylobacterium sp.]|jgi:hypothetical protein